MSPKKVAIVGVEVDPGTPGAVSKTHTSARPVPGTVDSAPPGLDCPRWAELTKARVRPGPANTTSEGSSPTGRVATTRGGRDPTSTTLTSSETWFTTQTSPSSRTATATGSIPTETEPAGCNPSARTSKISSTPSGVFATKSRVPSGESASGRTGPLSNTAARARVAPVRAANTASTRLPGTFCIQDFFACWGIAHRTCEAGSPRPEIMLDRDPPPRSSTRSMPLRQLVAGEPDDTRSRSPRAAPRAKRVPRARERACCGAVSHSHRSRVLRSSPSCSLP